MSLVLIPHQGEMARLMNCEPDLTAADPTSAVPKMVRHTGAVVALKGAETWIGAPHPPTSQ